MFSACIKFRFVPLADMRSFLTTASSLHAERLLFWLRGRRARSTGTDGVHSAISS
jgi:hypothetical protein